MSFVTDTSANMYMSQLKMLITESGLVTDPVQREPSYARSAHAVSVRHIGSTRKGQ